MRRLLVMMLVATSLAAIAPAIASSSASAADTPCNVSETWRGPYWWANVNADQSGSLKVLAVTPPWGLDSKAYLWDFNNDPRQEWYMDCVGYDSVRGWNKWVMHYAAQTSLCLDVELPVNQGVLTACNPGSTNQVWERIPANGATGFYNVNFNQCLDASGAGTSNGTPVILWSCHYGPNQLWY